MQSCPLQVQMRRLLAEDLPPAELSVLDAHVESCIYCQQTLKELSDDSMVGKCMAAHGTHAGETVSPRTENTAHHASPLSASACQFSPAAGLSGLLPPPQESEELGRLGGYRVLKIVGQGGMGAVFLAEDLQLRRPVALKVMRSGASAERAARERFLREARACAALRHDHIVTIYQVGEDHGVPFLAMEFLEGTSLERRLESDRTPTLAETLSIGRQVAQGLAAAHRKGLIHRDIKPANIWIEQDSGRVKILDFGLARAPAEESQLTEPGMIVGSPSYMAPEQARGEPCDGRTDLFSLGVVLYRLCTDRLPFNAPTTMGVLTALAVERQRPVGEINPAIPAELSGLIDRLLAKKPDDRPPSAEAVVEAIRAIEQSLGGEPVVDHPKETPYLCTGKNPSAPTKQICRPAHSSRATRRGLLIGLAVLLLAGGVLAGWVIIRDRNGKEVARVKVPEGGSVEVPGTSRGGRRTDYDVWLKEVAVLPADKQVEAVVAKLKERNPGFDEKDIRRLEGSPVTKLQMGIDKVTDLAPLQALAGLRTLILVAGFEGQCKLADISPLKGLQLTELVLPRTLVDDLTPLMGMPLTRLNVQKTKVFDLSPLQGMKLTDLNCMSCGVSDLSPLKGMPLTSLNLDGTAVADLSQLQDMPLTTLQCSGSKVTNLSPLRGMQLTYLWCNDLPISDLSPLAGMPLTHLRCHNTRVTDLSLLKDMPLKELWCDFRPERDAAILRGIKTLETINRRPAAEFWKAVDAGQVLPPP